MCDLLMTPSHSKALQMYNPSKDDALNAHGEKDGTIPDDAGAGAGAAPDAN